MLKQQVVQVFSSSSSLHALAIFLGGGSTGQSAVVVVLKHNSRWIKPDVFC